MTTERLPTKEMMHDPSCMRFIEGMRTALATYDAQGATAPDCHSDRCDCQFCQYVNQCRTLVKAFDDLRRTLAGITNTGERCPQCDSPAPNLHPAMQWEGEVQVCPDSWHDGQAGKDHQP